MGYHEGAMSLPHPYIYFLSPRNDPSFSIQYKLASKLVAEDPVNRSFLMIFGGSSVTAGHDNVSPLHLVC